MARRSLFVISPIVKSTSRLFFWSSVITLLLTFGLAVTSMKGDAPTFDEQGFLVRGLAYLRGESNGGNQSIRVGHPLGLNILNASLLVGDPTVKLPSNHESWLGTNFHRPAELFLWEIGNDVEHIMFLARIPTIWLGILLAAIGGRWAAEMASGWRRIGNHGLRRGLAGFITLLLLALDPNILAHTRLVTTDLGLTAAAAFAGFTLWRYLSHPEWIRAIVAGFALGLLLNTKFTALLFLPFFGILILLGIWAYYRSSKSAAARDIWKTFFQVTIIYPFVGFLVLWAGHGFQSSPLAAPLPMLGDAGGASVPLANYLDQLLDIGNRLEVSTPAFLLGQYSDSGWWYYFPVAFVFKTPLPVLLLLVWAFGQLFRRTLRGDFKRYPAWFDILALLIPAAGYFAIALTTSINLGYRHLLPILPFIYVFIGVVVAQTISEPEITHARNRSRVAATLLGWFVIVSLWIYPHYLAFFNLLAGGPNNGWRVLVDSNLDWGQDLKRLETWMESSGVDHVLLSYFGEARPDYYGISYTGLDSFPPRLMNPNARPFYPPDPAPGWYAISATNLQGVHFADHDQFAIFREDRPVEKIGYSIFLFERPAHGVPVHLLLGGLQVDQIPAADFAKLGTNDVELHWFDSATGLLIPGDDRPVWMATGETAIHPALATFIEVLPSGQETAEPASGLNPVGFDLPDHEGNPTELTLSNGRITFAGELLNEIKGSTWRGITTWKQMGEQQPTKIFIHILDGDGNIVAQWDGLAAEWEGWRSGDTLLQLHEISLLDVPPGTYRIVGGLYNPETLQRWQTTEGQDIIELGTVSVPK